MKLSSILNKNLIFLDYQFENYQEIINFISEKISHQCALSPETIKEAVLKRENLGTTFIGHRLAMPHGYVDNIDEIIVLFIRLSRELQVMEGQRARAVKYVFAIITSKNKAQLYLKVLSAIAQLVTHNTYILDNAENAIDFLEHIDTAKLVVDEKITARDLICCNASVTQTDTVSRAVDQMKQFNLTFLPVVNESGVLVGIIDLADLFAATFKLDPKNLELLHDMNKSTEFLGEPIKQFWDTEEQHRTGDLMRSFDTYTVHEHASYVEIVLLMTRHRHRYLVVVDNEKVVKGLIDTGDIVHKMIRA